MDADPLKAGDWWEEDNHCSGFCAADDCARHSVEKPAAPPPPPGPLRAVENP